MRVRILRDLRTRAGRTFREGAEHDLAGGDARVLIRRGVAVAIREPRKTRRRSTSEAGDADTAD